jgi:two-component system, NtrC family, response regulator HydG
MSKSLRILVIDDEVAMQEVLRARLEAAGHHVTTEGTGQAGLGALDSADPDVAIVDVKLPDLTGLEVLERLEAARPGLPVVLVTAHGSIDLAVDAMKLGARDFLTKPLDHDELASLLRAVGREIDERRRTRDVAANLEGEEATFDGLVGSSPAMQEVFHLIRELAPTDAAVLIGGESGTGKEVVARAIHRTSRRADQDLVAVNAAAIPKDLMESEIFGHEKGAFTGATGVRKGCFELAHGGTLFLDEIAEMPLALQPKLLRVLEDGAVRRLGGSREIRFDVRILSATNQVPREAVEKGRLREDLFYRLNVFSVELPPLRERAGDLPLLTQHFIELFNRKHDTRVEGVRDATASILEGHPWPGNVRELRNTLLRAVVLAKEGWIEPSHLPPILRESVSEAGGGSGPLPAGATLEEVERHLILQTLAATDNNKAETARRLGVDVKTIRNKLQRYGVTRKPK